MIPTHLLATDVSGYLARTRWFAGKGRPFQITGIRSVGDLAGDRVRAVVHLVEVTYDDAPAGEPEIELYQVPLAYYAEAEPRLEHAFVGWWEDPEHGWVHAYDAVHDRAAMALWLAAFAAAATHRGAVLEEGGLRFRRSDTHELDLDSHSTLFGGEQSNSTVIYGEDAVLKLFRKVTPGPNPDITVHDALTRAGSEYVAHLHGWVEHDQAGTPLQLGMLQEFLRTASDGWELAQASLRSLFGDPATRASDSGGDFAGEATRLGHALREVHAALDAHFPPAATVDAEDLAAAMSSRLEVALGVVPGLSDHTDLLRTRFAAVEDLGPIAAQQIHGDLHLGQTLRTASGWKIVDFEGEPAKPLDQRLRPDSPWRDVAGMLRSFDYAPRVAARSGEDTADPGTALAEQVEQWAERNKNHFLVAYAGGRLRPEDQILLDAYVADKAVYEAVYEARNRPTWVEVPLEALTRMGSPR